MDSISNNKISQHTEETLQAFVEAIIPRTPELAEEYGEIQYYGALDFQTEQYLLLSLNEFDHTLADSIVEMLDAAAKQLASIKGNGESTFSALSPGDRLLAMTLLRHNQITLDGLPMPFKNNAFNIIDDLTKLTMMGYYSEWFGYGSTRLKGPDQRELEFYPMSWSQIEYPGPTPGKNLQTNL